MKIGSSTQRAFCRDDMWRMILAILIPLPAFMVQWIFWAAIQPYVWFLFYPAVFFSAWIGGMRGGVAATIISTVSVWWFFIPTRCSFVLERPESAYSLAVFVCMGVLFSLTQERLRKAGRQAAEALAAVRAVKEELETRVGERTAELAQTVEALRASEARYRELFQANPHPMWVYDLETLAFLAVNDAAVATYGYSREEFLAMTIRDIRPGERLVDLDDSVRLVPGPLRRIGIWTHRWKNGTLRQVEIVTHDLAFDGRAARLVLANDMTEHMATEEQVRRLNAELEDRVDQRTDELEKTKLALMNIVEDLNQKTDALAAANRELETYTYSVSHDLKAPLRGIDGFSRLLEEECGAQLGDEGRRFLATIRRSVAQMYQLIEDLLDYSRLERRELRHDPLDLAEVVKSALAERAAEVCLDGAVLRVGIPSLTVRADRYGLTIALRNLLENAFKFSRDADPPTIEIGARAEEGKVLLWVRDNGIGFDMRHHDRIFEIFQRLQRSEGYPGTGIGLALVRKAMQRMGGQVWAESAPGAGATFYLELPA